MFSREPLRGDERPRAPRNLRFSIRILFESSERLAPPLSGGPIPTNHEPLGTRVRFCHSTSHISYHQSGAPPVPCCPLGYPRPLEYARRPTGRPAFQSDDENAHAFVMLRPCRFALARSGCVCRGCAVWSILALTSSRFLTAPHVGHPRGSAQLLPARRGSRRRPGPC